MKKIMFDDHYGLEKAVLNGTKTMTRRLMKPLSPAVKEVRLVNGETQIRFGEGWVPALNMHQPRFKVGEEVAIAQSYYKIFGKMEELEKEKGYKNKMYVCADVMPWRIQITDVRIERLQDISDEDCLREGIVYDEPFPELADPNVYAFPVRGKNSSSIWRSPSPKIAFENLIRHMMGKKVWDENPWVFAYSFKLVL